MQLSVKILAYTLISKVVLWDSSKVSPNIIRNTILKLYSTRISYILLYSDKLLFI